MGLQDKLLKAYIKGCKDTWDLVYDAAKSVPGIGPKTQAKLLEALKVNMLKEVDSVDNLSEGSKRKLNNVIKQVGGK